MKYEGALLSIKYEGTAKRLEEITQVGTRDVFLMPIQFADIY